MRFLLGFIISFSLLIMLFSCGNDGGISPQKRRLSVAYSDFHRYAGSTSGATKVEVEYKEGWDKDSLYHRLVTARYFQDTLKQKNKIAFEFIDTESKVLSFIDENERKTILSTYEFKDDSLFIWQSLADRDSLVFVAVREEDGDSYYRTFSVLKYIYTEEGEDEQREQVENKKDTSMSVNGGKLLNLQAALEFAGIKDSVSMTNVKDTVVWCNVKYIYR